MKIRVLGALGAALAVIGVLTINPAASHAATFYTDETSFNSAAPTATAIGFGGLTNGYYSSLAVSGVTFTSVHPLFSSEAMVVYNGLVGNATFGDTLVLSFGSGVTAVGTNIINQIAEPGGPTHSAPITEEVYAGSTLLGQKTVTETSGFFGVTSATDITKITFFSDCNEDCSSLLSNLSVATQASATTPLPAALPLFATGLGVMGLFRWRKKAARAA